MSDSREEPAAEVRQAPDSIELARVSETLRGIVERQQFLLTLGDALRPLRDAGDVQRVATQLLGEYLRATQVRYGETVGDLVVTKQGYGLPPTIGDSRQLNFGERLTATLRAGRTAVSRDITSDPTVTAAEAAAFEGIGLRATVGVPVTRNGRLLGVLSAHDARPREWTPEEIALIEHTAVIVNDLSERRRTEAALHKSEAQFRLFVTASSDIVYRMSADWSELRALEGKRLLADTINPSATWLDKYIPHIDKASVRAAIDQAIHVKGMFELEHHVIRADGTVGWVFSRAVPLMDEHGCIIEWLGAASDITERKHAEDALRASEERQSFLLRLSDILRPLADPVEVQDAAVRLLGEKLRVDRCYYAEIDQERQRAVVKREYLGSRRYSVIGEHPLAPFQALVSLGEKGETIVCDNIATHPLLSVEANAYRERAVAALVVAPLVKRDLTMAFMCLTMEQPREWTPHEVRLLSEVAERTWAAVERALAEEALAESKERYRTLFEFLDEGVTTVEAIFDGEGKPFDYRFLEHNPMYEKLAGIETPLGTTARQSIPGVEDYWVELIGEVARSGEAVRTEFPVDTLGRWYSAYFSRVGGPSSRQVICVYDDITVRKRQEANLAFLAEVSQELAHLTSIGETMSALGSTIVRHFNASRCAFVEINEAADEAVVEHDWHRADLPSLVGNYRIGAFITAESWRTLRAGLALVTKDSESDSRVNADRFAAIQVAAFMAIPIIRAGQLHFVLGVFDSQPRDWRDDEIELLREIAARIWTRLERARADTALRESEERLRVLIESVKDYAIVTLDPEGRITSWSEGARRLKGYTADEIVGQPVSRFYPPDAAGKPDAEMQRAMAVGRSEDESWRIRKDGSRFWVNEIMTPLRTADGQHLGFTRVSRDLTERKAFEDALRMVDDHLGFPAALGNVVSGWSERVGIATTFNATGTDALRLSLDAQAHLYQLVQDALNNISTHATATSVTVRLKQCEHQLMLVIEDDGRGFSLTEAQKPSGNGNLGLVSMRERAELVGGALEIDTAPSRGTTIRVRIPMSGRNDGAERRE